jgi:hypothetical protein
MPIYKLKLFEYQKIKNTYEVEFDTSDQKMWDALLDAAAKFDDVRPEENPLYDIPRSAPADPEKWFELSKLIYEANAPFICTKTSELIPSHDGEFEIDMGYQLENNKGDIVLQEIYDDLV